MFFWILTFLVSGLFVGATGEVRCYCNTPECQYENQQICIAPHSCYVEFRRVNSYWGRYESTFRGCTDNRDLVTCNVLPDPYSAFDMWPVTKCCRENWCNSDLIMQLKRELPDAPLRRNTPAFSTTLQPSPKPKMSTPKNNPKPVDQEEKPLTAKKDYIRVVYIVAPITAACLLLSVIVILIYVIKRRELLKFSQPPPQYTSVHQPLGYLNYSRDTTGVTKTTMHHERPIIYGNGASV